MAKKKVQYPNPDFWKYKDNMQLKPQMDNLKEVGGIFWEMLKETDWKKFGQDRINDFKADGARIKEEFEAFMGASNEEKIDLILHGEKHLGRLYRKGAMATVRREWRGIALKIFLEEFL